MFEDAPAAFDGIVRAVIGRILYQAYCQAVLAHEVHEALHKLGASAMVFRAIIQINDQHGGVRKPEAYCFPTTGPVGQPNNHS